MLTDEIDFIFGDIRLTDEEKKLILQRIAYKLFINQLKGAGYFG